MVKTKILLVEDDKSLREIYGVRLYSEGYDIISAGDGEEALAMAIKERPTLIISDVMMPKISGFDMLDILRSTTETKSIKVVMMTALSSEDQRARGEALGADRYLVKSQVGIEDVVRTVHEVLGDAPVSGMAAAPPATAPSFSAQTPAIPVIPGAPSSPEQDGGTLPQPTAPFSTNRPASLGDRIIHPIESNEPSRDFGAMMSAELGGTPQAPATPAIQTVPEVPLQGTNSVIPPLPAASFEQTDNSSHSVIPDPEMSPVYTSEPTPSNTQPMAPQSPAEQPLPAMAQDQPPTAPQFNNPADDGQALGEQPAQPAVDNLAFEETPYAPNPVIAPQAPSTPAPSNQDDDEPPLVIPPRRTTGVQ